MSGTEPQRPSATVTCPHCGAKTFRGSETKARVMDRAGRWYSAHLATCTRRPITDGPIIEWHMDEVDS